MRCRVVAVALAVLPMASLLPAMATPAPQSHVLSLTTEPTSQDLDALEALGVTLTAPCTSAGACLVAMPADSVARVAALPFVASVVPDEPLAPMLDSSKAAVGAGPQIAAAGFDGDGVTVAVIDSGVDESHPGLAGRIVAQFSFDENGVRPSTGDATGHGTHVAGIIAGDGSGSASRDLSGIAPAARIVSLDLSSQFTTSNALRAFEWLHDHHDEYGIRVVVNSWGRERDVVEYDPDDPLIRASNALINDGLVMVFSAGNGGSDPGHMTLEASNPYVITVGASSDDGRVEPYSSRGPVLLDGQTADWFKPDVLAPGTRIVSARADGGPGRWYVTMNGTSMSAPHVAGIAAVLVGQAPELTPGQVQHLLWETATDVGPDGPDHASGYGVADLHAALDRILQASAQPIRRVDEVRESGSVQGVGGGQLRLLSRQVAQSDSFVFTVAQDAVRAAVHLNWSGSGQVSVTLTEPAGRATTRQVASHALFEVADPSPGRYTVDVEPSGASRGDYDAHVTMLRYETREPLPLPPPPPRPKDASFPAMGLSQPLSLLVLPGVPLFVPAAVLAVLVVVVVATFVWRRP